MAFEGGGVSMMELRIEQIILARWLRCCTYIHTYIAFD